MKHIRHTSVLCVAGGQEAASGFKMLLKKVGAHQVFVTDDVTSVFDIVDGATIDVLLINDDPPEIDGVELCKSVRTSNSSPNARLPVVMVLRENSMTRTIDASAAGVHEMMFYPISPNKLLQRITRAVNDTRTFIESESYVGPDRRVGPKKLDGPLRRTEDFDGLDGADGTLFLSR